MKSRLSIISVVLLALCSSHVFADDAKSPLRAGTLLPGSPESFCSSESSFGPFEDSASPASQISDRSETGNALKAYTDKWLAGIEERVVERKKTAQKLEVEFSAFDEAYALVENTYLDFIYSNGDSSSFWEAVGNVPDFNSFNDLIERMKLFKQNQYGYYESPFIETHRPSKLLVYKLTQISRKCSDIAHKIVVMTLADSWPQGSESVKDWDDGPASFFISETFKTAIAKPFSTLLSRMQVCDPHAKTFFAGDIVPADGYQGLPQLIRTALEAAELYRQLQVRAVFNYC